MRRPQFSLKTLLWWIAAVGVLLAAWLAVKPSDRVISNNKREYLWQNGLAIAVSQDGIKIETGVDVSKWKTGRLSEARGRYGHHRLIHRQRTY